MQFSSAKQAYKTIKTLSLGFIFFIFIIFLVGMSINLDFEENATFQISLLIASCLCIFGASLTHRFLKQKVSLKSTLDAKLSQLGISYVVSLSIYEFAVILGLISKAYGMSVVIFAGITLFAIIGISIQWPKKHHFENLERTKTY